ncbi:MAG: hypothetical protein GY815_13275 [Gammaproteobacteria bacterium]|nr:hypothetical protein [Gammaproteobacteria bacterium]
MIAEQTAKPGTHVLVIGVSEYLHFYDGKQPNNKGELLDMAQLSSAARSASEFAAWMLNEYQHTDAPLSSLRVLLSPSDGETIHPDIAARLAGDCSATLSNVESELIAFRALCDLHQENVAVVYVAGHGVQLTKNGAIVLLYDCGSNQHATLLKGAIDMAGVHAGFNHPNTAQTQFWFVDACRQKSKIAKRFETLAGGFTLDEPVGAADSPAMFLAATTGTQAYARIGGVTLFNEALLWALRGGIANSPDKTLSQKWHISTLELVKSLRPKVRELADQENAEQTVDSKGIKRAALFHEYPQIPTVKLRVDLLPDNLATRSEGLVEDKQSTIVAQTSCNWPMQECLEAGLYKIKIGTPAGFPDVSDLLSLSPPDEAKEYEIMP